MILSKFGPFFTQHDPLKGDKNWSHRAQWQIKLLNNYWLKHISYKNQIPKRFSDIIRSKHAWKVYLKSFLVKNWNFLVKNGPKMGKIDFSQNFHWANIVIDHKCGFYKNKRANDGPPHHRASQKYLYQHKDTILCQPSYF